MWVEASASEVQIFCFPVPDAGQVLLLLLLASESDERGGDRRVGEVAVGHAPVLHRLDEDELVQGISPAAAVLDRPAHPHPAALGERRLELPDPRTWNALAPAVLGEQLGSPPLVDELGELVAKFEVLPIPSEIHVAPPTALPEAGGPKVSPTSRSASPRRRLPLWAPGPDREDGWLREGHARPGTLDTRPATGQHPLPRRTSEPAPGRASRHSRSSRWTRRKSP
jgi:hypothetical protein